METYSIQDLSKTLATLDDLELWQRTTAAAQQEKHCCAVVIAHIAEVRKRKLFLLHACHSLFDITDIALAAKDPAIKAAQRTARKNPRPPKAERKNPNPQAPIVAPQARENSREQSAPDSPRLKKDVSSPHKKRSRTIMRQL